MHAGGQDVGELGDEVFGEPSVDFLVREYRLPVRLVLDIVPQFQPRARRIGALRLICSGVASLKTRRRRS